MFNFVYFCSKHAARFFSRINAYSITKVVRSTMEKMRILLLYVTRNAEIAIKEAA
jgi:hypothetical protein